MLNVKLGKKAVRHDDRTLKLAKYVRSEAILAPQSCSYHAKVATWPMMLNDNLGDCVIAAAGHNIMQWSAYAGIQHNISDQDVLTGYEQVGGYVPGNPSTDNGCDMLTALNYWRKTGFGGHQILAYVQVNPRNIVEVEAAIYLFGNLYIGLALPVSAQGQSTWTVLDPSLQKDGQPGSWGGHCVPIVGYNVAGFTVVTWGQTLWMSRNFFQTYCDEAYAVLSKEWIDTRLDASVNGVDLATLRQDLLAVAV